MSVFRVSPVFSNNMVLQRGKNINVFGSGESGKIVTVEFEGERAETKVRNGQWLAVLPKRESGEGLTMTVTCENESKIFTNIVMGEVWLAGGQSNMELELQNCKDSEKALSEKNVNVRFYYTQKIVMRDSAYDEKTTNSGWETWDSENRKSWSAVGYYFAKELSEKLGCTVGVIGCNWGGTKAAHWMSRESLIKDEDMAWDWNEYAEAIDGKSDEELFNEYREYEEYSAEWNRKNAEYYTNTPNPTWDECLKVCGECRYPGPLNPYNPFRAESLYESMIKLVCPYTMKGFIYYQGESDDPRPMAYYKLLRGLIELWREDWNDEELSFLIVQLPMHRYSGDSDRKNWCFIREAQEKAYKTVKNTGLAVIIDCGEFNEIHPKDKLPVGHRLCLQALYNTYGDKSVKAFSPLYKSHLYVDGGIEISFDYADGFEVKGEKCGFEIAGEDLDYKPCDFEIRGNKIFVKSEDVKEPLYVRYLWTNYGDVTLYGDNGLPVAPFRTERILKYEG